MGGFKQFLRDEGYDVEALEQNTWSAKRGRELMAELEAKYKLPQRNVADPKPSKTSKNAKEFL